MPYLPISVSTRKQSCSSSTYCPCLTNNTCLVAQGEARSRDIAHLVTGYDVTLSLTLSNIGISMFFVVVEEDEGDEAEEGEEEVEDDEDGDDDGESLHTCCGDL